MKNGAAAASLLAAVALLLPGCASLQIVEVVETEEQATQDSLFGRYLKSSIFLDPLGDFLADLVQRHDKDLGLTEPGQLRFTGTRVFVEKPVKFAAGVEHPVAGLWHMRLPAVRDEGAGSTARIYNVYCFAEELKAPRLADGVMGQTICDLELQQDVIAGAFVAVYVSTGSKPLRGQTPVVVDTRLKDMTKLDVARGRGSWTEQWILMLGAETITIDVEFTRRGEKTDISLTVPRP